MRKNKKQSTKPRVTLKEVLAVVQEREDREYSLYSFAKENSKSFNKCSLEQYKKDYHQALLFKHTLHNIVSIIEQTKANN